MLQRFVSDGPAFVSAPGAFDPTSAAPEVMARADRLATDLPEVVRLLDLTRNRAAVDVLGRVAVRLAHGAERHLDAVLASLPGLRGLLVVAGDPAVARDLDERLIGESMLAGRWEAALELLAQALAAWPDDAATWLARRAEILRRLERWEDCRADLDRADALLADQATGRSWALRVELAGARTQLELALGRLDVAARALAAGQDALDAGRRLLAAADPRLAFLAAGLAQVRADLDLAAGRHALVLAGLDAWLATAPPGTRFPPSMELQRALAHDGLELEGLAEDTAADAALERCFADDRLAPAQRVVAGLRLAVRQLHAGRLEPAAALLDELGRRLGPDGSLDLPLERGIHAMLCSRLARATGAEAAALEAHLREVAGAFGALLAAWAAAPLLPGGLGFLQSGPRQEILAELLRLRRDVDPDGARAALGDVLAAQALGSLARRLRLEVPDLDTLRDGLVRDGGLLIYLPAVRGGWVLVVDRDDVLLVELPGRMTLRSLARAVERGDGGAAQDLASALLPDVVRARLPGWSHLDLVGVDGLEGARVESLPLDVGVTLGRRLPLARLPSVSVGLWCAREPLAPVAAGPSGLALGVAASPSAAVRERWPELAPIPFGAVERGRLRAAFGEPPEAPAPTRAWLRDAAFDGARVLHLLCHGVWDGDSARPASLVLAPEGGTDPGLVGCDAVEAPARSYPPLVILSACGAARGPRRLGDDGLAHLGGAFLRGGARAVLLADDALGYADALDLAEQLHAALATGASPAEALRRARAALDVELPVWLLGAAHEPLFLPAPTRPWWPAAVVGLVLAAWLLGRRRRGGRARG